MSAAVVQSVEHLIVTATTRLADEIKAETDPARLERLFTLAFRARVPRQERTPLPGGEGQGVGFSSLHGSSTTTHTTKPTAITSEAALPAGDCQGKAKTTLAAAGPGIRPFGERLSDAPLPQPAPIAPTTAPLNLTPSAHSPPSTLAAVPAPVQSTTPSARSDLGDLSAPPTPTTDHSAPPSVEPPDADEDLDEDLPPPCVPLTDAEYLKLQSEIGFPEANRRRLIRFHLSYEHARAKLNRLEKLHRTQRSRSTGPPLSTPADTHAPPSAPTGSRWPTL